MLLPRSATPGPRHCTSSITKHQTALTTCPPQSPISRLFLHRNPLPSRADDHLLLVARGAERSSDAAGSLVLSTSVAGGAGLKRVVRVSHTIGAVGVSAPALAVEVAKLRILVSHISIQNVFHPVSFLKYCSHCRRSSASYLGRDTGTTGQPGW